MIENPFTDELKAKLRQFGSERGTVVFSISKEPVEEVFDDGERLTVRWICWSINNKEGLEVSKPEFSMVHPDLTLEILRSDIGEEYDGWRITYDHNVGH